MKMSLLYETAINRHQDEVNQVISKLRQGKSIHKDVLEQELTWYYYYAKRINLNSTFSSDESEYVISFGAEIGKWNNTVSILQNNYLEEIKEEIEEYENRINETAIPEDILSNPIIKIDDKEYPILGGYENKEGKKRIMVWSTGTKILYTLDDNNAYWSGGLTGLACKRFEETEEGELFIYRNSKFKKLCTQEILDLITNKIFLYAGIN